VCSPAPPRPTRRQDYHTNALQFAYYEQPTQLTHLSPVVAGPTLGGSVVTGVKERMAGPQVVTDGTASALQHLAQRNAAGGSQRASFGGSSAFDGRSSIGSASAAASSAGPPGPSRAETAPDLRAPPPLGTWAATSGAARSALGATSTPPPAAQHALYPSPHVTPPSAARNYDVQEI